ncbi:hypothetical protein [Flavobacterium johnsoniae]|uniref:Uncharacterized protein n=1 Tax=Flavobacterium johnsoniae (strain ATCC 17061 / DSM 2064 / JCM 8514 / BCRC 14874 / CCUG 350202 / NBRC 14942 / NCIMB 11054 / UW101) TaxID=376686 RepID=A5FMK1_FLAJ1|nr:hypothetical protein [Flavobacterium johnsoniae]ABQ03574.1 hypothetical protein Fjoh_0539 [Flavobacterium johnsoniae UW101]OXE95996.1 hypothetical protein B0A63_22805 [Flavobacterium johnsoniae UW101]WQG79562.1 hypothetical protein SR927_16190 [Flavobacterium johnsoniae UW101]SHL96066.1 hypothetical protein SAMN05444146_5047 [Flavobacterium johnsoniae]
MLKKLLFCMILFWYSGLMAQETETLYKTKKVIVTKDTIHLEKVSINSGFFEILNTKNQPIDSTFYKIDFKKGTLLFNEKFTSVSDTLIVNYLNYPDFLTKEYGLYKDSQVVSSDVTSEKLYKIDNGNAKKAAPFDGLSTSGSITRGVTIGNNQSTVLNSNLDLQITGKISDKVSLRASLQDNNIPLQDGGYSQKLDQFDNIFMELFTDDWNIRAGDVFLENRKTQFLSFNKKVQGLAASFDFDTEKSKTNVFASVSFVKGQYAKSTFTGQEGNQGPYKLKGQNGELYVLVISGSERVYVNGVLLKRGENNDYVIDYNAGEIVFTSLFTITSEMRINVEYQYSERNYNRLVTYAGVTTENKSWSFGGYIYSENDMKNQPLQQNLSTEQVQILAQAGDDINLMKAPSAFEDTYSENKILYKKILVNSVEAYEYSNNSADVLYNVKFSLVGNNLGNYIIQNTNSVERIYQYVSPIGGIPQGNYEPIVQLVAPMKIQVATFLGKYNPDEKTLVDFEIAMSNNDKNLFSSIDDSDNEGIAFKTNIKKRLFTRNWTLDGFANYQFVQKDFRSVERLYNIEFNRDWNLNSTLLGNQSLLVTGINFDLFAKKETSNIGLFTYQFEKLDFSESYSGARHTTTALFKLKKWTIENQGSFLNSDATASTSKFIRNQTRTKYHFGKNWVGGSLQIEDNQEKDKATNQFSALSQRFSEYGVFVGRGDSTKVFVELGYLQRRNDSLQNGLLQHVNNSQTYFLKSKLIQNKTTDLAVYASYRNLDFTDSSRKNEPSLNSRVLYNDRFFNQFMQIGTAYETSSGTIAQQEFTYVEVPTGQGVYTWNDYNGNGIQELEEFEIAAFPDQAKYIRIFLPNQVYIKTNQNKFSQSVILNPLQWQNEKGLKKLLSYLYNQTSFIMDRKVRSNGDRLELNPFYSSDENVLGLNSSFRNSLFYNRGKQKHSVTYTYLINNGKNLLSVGSQSVKNSSHQLQYTHLYQKSWLFNFFTKTIKTDLISKDFVEKNYDLKGYQLAPKISYLFSKNTSLDFFYEFQNKENQIGNFETLVQNRLGTAFSFAGEKKVTINGEFSFYENKFNGNEFSSVGFQMLEGLQQGQNLVWKLLLQKNITQFLDVNLNYQGRKSETGNTIHTGNVQLRAYF